MINYLNHFNLALTAYSEVIFVTTSTTGWWWWGENALESQLWVRVGDGIINPFSMVCSASMITNGYLPTIHSMAMAGLKPIAILSTTTVKWRKNIYHSNLQKFTISIAIFMSQHQRWQDEKGSRAMPCLSINFGKMRMVRGLYHGRPVGGDWLGSEASPTTTLVKPAWDVGNFYY